MTIKDKPTLLDDILNNLPDNTAKQIRAEHVRNVLSDLVDSTFDLVTYDPRNINLDVYDERSHKRAFSMTRLMSINPETYSEVELLGFYSEGDWEDLVWRGGIKYTYKPDEPRANHDGGRIIDPTHSETPGDPGWYESENTGNGCWVCTPRLNGQGSCYNAKIFGLRGNCVIEEVDYDKDLHTNGYEAFTPHKIRQAQGVKGVDYDDDTIAWKAWMRSIRSGEQWHLPATDTGRAYYLTNDSDPTSMYVYLAEWVELEDVLITGAPPFVSRVFIDLDLKLYSLWLFHSTACQRIEWRHIYFDAQGIGHSDRDNHPHYLHTRLGIAHIGASGVGYGDYPKPNDSIGLRYCRIRWNHPEGASPGEHSGIDDDSSKLILIQAYGSYVAATTPNTSTGYAGGELPPSYDPNNLVYNTYIDDCLIEESQTRGLWSWMAHGSRTNRNIVLRSGGNRPCLHRMTHYTAFCEANNNYIECEGAWKFNNAAHSAPVGKSHNNGFYVDQGVKINNNIIIRRSGQGIMYDGVKEGSECKDNIILMAPGETQTVTTYLSAIRCFVNPTYNGTTDRKGEIRNALIANNIHVGGNGFEFYMGPNNLLSRNVSIDAIDVAHRYACLYGTVIESSQAIRPASTGILLLGSVSWTDGSVIEILNPLIDHTGSDATTPSIAYSNNGTKWLVRGGSSIGNKSSTGALRGSGYGNPMIWDGFTVRGQTALAVYETVGNIVPRSVLVTSGDTLVGKEVQPKVTTNNSPNSSFTLTAGVNPEKLILLTDFTGNRTLTLSQTNAWFGAMFDIIRLGGGAFDLTIAGLKDDATVSISEPGRITVAYTGLGWIVIHKSTGLF